MHNRITGDTAKWNRHTMRETYKSLARWHDVYLCSSFHQKSNLDRSLEYDRISSSSRTVDQHNLYRYVHTTWTSLVLLWELSDLQRVNGSLSKYRRWSLKMAHVCFLWACHLHICSFLFDNCQFRDFPLRLSNLPKSNINQLKKYSSE